MALGYDFQSDLTFYKVPRNINGKMSLQMYINQILELVVKSQLMEKQDFVLEEDGDNEYGKAKNCNIVRQQKEENNLKYFFNYASFLDLSPIKNC